MTSRSQSYDSSDGDEYFTTDADKQSIDPSIHVPSIHIGSTQDSSSRLSRKDSAHQRSSVLSKLAFSPGRLLASPTRILQSLSPGRKKDPDVDTSIEASIDGISRSFAGFLTTASIYAGFQDIEEANEEPNEDEQPIPNPTALSSPTISSPPTAPSSKSRFEISFVERKPTLSDQRAAELSLRLRKTFQIPEDSEFIADYSCWLMGDVLLQGHLYITNECILFSAFLPKKGRGKIVQQGALSVKSTRFHRKWAILRESTLSIYSSSTELYFPDLVIDLRSALRAEIHHSGSEEGSVWLKVVTSKKTYWFLADSLSSARSWVSTIKRQIFQSRNHGDQAIVKIPLQSILDLELTTVLGETKNLRIKVIENPDSYAIDDYFVLFFSQGEKASEDIRRVIKDAGIELGDGETDEECSELMKSKAKLLKESEIAVETTNYLIGEEGAKVLWDSKEEVEEEEEEEAVAVPSRSSRYSPWGHVQAAASSLSSLALPFSSPTVSHFGPETVGDPFYVADSSIRKQKQESFLQFFSLPDELLVASYHAYILRGLPSYGRLYIGTHHLCFRSTLPGSGTLMILPFADIENAAKEQGFRFGYSGLVVVIHGHEELFFEFSNQNARDDCECQLLRQLDVLEAEVSPSSRSGSQTLSSPPDSVTLASARIRLVESKLNDSIGADVPIIMEDHPLQKTEVHPSRPYRFTLLTIGSRGDVQPYIALGKALMKEGHKVKIVTHAEFGPWIKSHGLEFDVIAGDPSELMALMVSHPTISYSFVRDARSKFSSWIDELLESSWKACQGTDVLIESPSSFAGIHIAEALQIPYFRAFTMPWSRTRAYPNAFLVPDQKLGGSYNYMTHVAVENGYWRGVSNQVNRWREQTLHISRTSLAAMRQSSIPFLYNISPVVFPPSVDFPEWVKVTGYWFLNEGGEEYKPDSKLVEFIRKAREDGKKLVYVGFGSIVVDKPKELSRAVANAVLEADVRLVLNKGWSERGSTEEATDEVTAEEEVEGGNPEHDDANTPEFPPEVFSSGSVPHDWLFPLVDAAVHHGGSGTTGASLKFGLPTVIKPFFGDQKFYASRVEDLGCGVVLKELNCHSLAVALKEVTTNKRIQEKAKLIGKKIRAENGVQNAINAIYSEMEYARSLSAGKYKAMKGEMERELAKEEEEEEEEEIIGDEREGEDEEEGEEGEGEGSWLLV
ncbi:DEKNAAC103744 [Brettanomyces naardenensis]|uniref:Sterol 3-beta-glucosyltransferase n=1 Tax=Brettanomyces naardenensis TaxID=13370 RepID=A0A448YPA2_BRENA|nr:DEKNAAC103744 [Brettanomyces naardenensis]